VQTTRSEGETIEETLSKYVKPKLAVDGAALTAKLKAGTYYTTSERIFLVKVLARRLMKTSSKYESSRFKFYINVVC
jgi:hypothetical protein